MKKKEHKLILLPTNTFTNIHCKNGCLGGVGSKLYLESFIGNKYNSFHLYLLSNEEIKEGDWCINVVSKTIFQANKQFIKLITEPNITLTTNKKILATTNANISNLGKCNQCGAEQFLSYHACNYNGICKGKVIPLLPNFPQSFINYYIEQYNKGNVLTKVMVEYETMHTLTINKGIDSKGDYRQACPKCGRIDSYMGNGKDVKCYEKECETYSLKIDSNNCISIISQKESWNRDEVIRLMKSSINRGIQLLGM